jgi:hypothetical protein
MSRYFASAADHLDNAFPLTTTPFTISAWVKYSTLATLQQIFSMGTGGSGLQRWSLGIGSSNVVNVVTRDTATVNAVSAIALPPNTWCLFTGTYATADAARAAFGNGTNKGTDFNIKTITAPNVVRVSGDPSSANVLLGAYVAHIGLWNIELSDAAVALLYTMPPNFVNPANLVEYWTLANNASPEPSIGTTPHDLIVTGTTYSTDDPFFNYPILMGQAVF